MEEPIGPVFLVALVVATALGVIGALRARARSKGAGRRRRKGGVDARRWPPFKQCPLCGTVLAHGEQVRTARFPERDGKAPVQVSGCSHCYGPGADTARRCPVCRQSLGAEDYLHGTMWRQSEHSGPRQPGQPAPFHVRIRGCTRCVGGARRAPAPP